MKKIFTILLCLVISVSLFAQEDVRSMGMGGNHITDYSNVYITQKNPAGLGFAGKHDLWTNTQIGLSGPLEDFMNIVDKLSNSEDNQNDNLNSYDSDNDDDSSEIEDAIIDLVKKNNGLATGVNLVGPLQFGFTKNGFGMLFSEELFVDVNVPSISRGKVNIGLDANLLLGYGHKIDLGISDLSIGISANLFSRAINIGVDGSLTEIFDKVEDMDNLPATSMIGYGINAGVQYEFANFLSAGIVWNNILAQTYTTDIPLDEDSDKEFTFKDARKEKLDPTLAVGFGVKIPTSFTLGIISSWTAYLDHDNILDFFEKDKIVRNPILGLSAGTEVVLFKTIALRLGIHESYPAAGCGIRLAAFHIDAAVFGSELGLEPGAKPQLNAALSISFHR